MKIQNKPIEFSMVPKKHPSLYLMHKYWARKPHNIVRQYIEHFTSPNDVILDPFNGSGVSVIEAIRSGRKAIGVDINPTSRLIALGTLAKVQVKELNETFQAIEDQVKTKILRLYDIPCPTCNEKAEITHIVWSRCKQCPNCGEEVVLANAKKLARKYTCPYCQEQFLATQGMSEKEEPLEVWLQCECTKKQIKIEVTANLKRYILEKEDIAVTGFPKTQFIENKRILAAKGMTLRDLFTNRAAKALVLLDNAVESIEDPLIKTVFRLTFSASLAQTSKLIAYRGGFSSGGSAWSVPGFWMPAHHVEINVWKAFSQRYEKTLRGKLQSYSDLPETRVGTSFDDLDEDNCLLFTQSSTDLSNIPSESISYVFTDPPYGDSVPYLEFSTMWNAWLKDKPDFSSEIVVSDSTERQKDLTNYEILLGLVFKEVFRVLKPEAWLSVTFHNNDLAVWKALVSSILNAGFHYVNDVYQVPAHISSKAQLSRNGSSTGDIVINFRKTKIKQKRKLSDLSEEDLAREAKQFCALHGGSASTDQINRALIHTVIKSEALSLLDTDLRKVLNQALSEVDRHNWQLKKEDLHLLRELEPIGDKLKKLIFSDLSRGTRTTEEILALVFSNLKNGETPDNSEIFSCLEGLAKKDEKGRWRLKDNEVKQLSLLT